MGNPKKQMLIGGSLLVFGWLLIFAMVLDLVPTEIWLNMVAYAITLVGFMIGTIGIVSVIRLSLKEQ